MGQLMEERAVVFFGAVKQLGPGHVDGVYQGAIVGSGLCIVQRRPLGHGGDQGFTALDGLKRLLVRFPRRLNAGGLLKIEHGIVAKQRDALGLLLFAVRCRFQPFPEYDRRALLALADTPTSLIGLLKGKPVGRGKAPTGKPFPFTTVS